MSDREHLDLRHFNKHEFAIEQRDGSLVDWWPQMSLRLLVLLDVFRYRWGRPCTISPVAGALGRRLGHSAETQHNVDRWHEVRAVDFFPEGMVTPDHARHAVELARLAGFTGVAVYPHWDPQPGLHVDVRRGEAPGDPATWGGVLSDGGQVYVGLEQALGAFA